MPEFNGIPLRQPGPAFGGQPITPTTPAPAGASVSGPAFGGEPITKPPKPFNMLRGAVERGGNLLSGLFTSIGEAGDYMEQKIPLGGFVFDGGLPKYLNADQYRARQQSGEVENLMEVASDRAANFSAGYVPVNTWESVKQAFTTDGVNLGDFGVVAKYGLEQGIQSIPDMAAVLINLPGYVVARAGEIGQTRAANKGKDQADIVDVVEAAPFALGSALLERLGAGRITNPTQIGQEALEAGFANAAKVIGKDALGSATTEALTEAVQEGILEYAGENLGTGVEMSAADAAERALAGAVAGGVYGGAAGAVTSTANQVVRPKTVGEMVMEQLAREMNARVDAAQPAGVTEQVIRSMSPQAASEAAGATQAQTATDIRTGAGSFEIDGAAAASDQQIPFVTEIEREEYQQAIETGLPMDNESRLQRARDMGFNVDIPVYHGTSADIPAFRIGRAGGIYFTDDPQWASMAAGGEAFSDNGGNVISAYLSMQNPKQFDFGNKQLRNAAEVDQIVEYAKSQGYDSVIIQNIKDTAGEPHTQYIVFDPSQVRSVNAAFDPEYQASPDLLASRSATVPAFGREADRVGAQPQSDAQPESLESIRRTAERKTDQLDRSMPGYVPMYSSAAAVPVQRPANNQFNLGDRVITLNPENNPTRRENIRQMLEGIIGPRIYNSKIKGKATLGFYRRNNSEVRIRNYDDVEVMAHEMAHFLDFHKGHDKKFTKFRNDKRYVNQIKKFSYTADPALVKSEGFAEFVRLWLTQYDKVAQSAPEATKAFEALLAQDKTLNRKMLRMQEEMHKWYLQGPRATFRAKSGKDLTPAQQISKWVLTAPSERYRQNVIDKIHGIKVVERTIRGDIADAAISPYKQFQMVNGAEATHEAIVKYGTPILTPEGDFQFRGKGLNQIFWPAAKHGWDRFDNLMEYFKARRAEELMMQGRENLFTTAEIRSGLEYGNQHPEFRQIFDEFQQFNREMLDFYVQMGLITNEQREAFQKANQNYVPFHRIIEKIEDGGEIQETAPIGQRLKGGTMNTKDIAQNIVEGLYANVRAAMIARAKQTLYTDIMNSQEGSLFAVRIGPDTRLVKAQINQQAQKIAQAMAGLGLGISVDGQIVTEGEFTQNDGDAVIFDTTEITQLLERNPELMMFWQSGVRPKTTETYVDSAIIDGKQLWFEVRSPLLVDALTGMRGFKSSPLLDAMFRVKNIQTRTVTSMLQFLGPNAIRDTISSYVISKNQFVPVWDTLRGMGELIFDSKLYREFMLNAGGYGTRVEARTEELRARRQLDLPAATGWDRAAKVIAGYDRFASMFEYGSRLGDYRKGRKAGKNALQAAWEAREVATDFSKMPRSELWAKYLRMVPFMNAGIQGLDKTIREIAEIRGEMTVANIARVNDAKVRFLAAGATITAMTAILWLMNQDDERYQALTPDQKARFWWIFLDEGTEPIKIPRPYDIGHIFATIPESGLDYIKDRDGRAAAENIGWALVNTLGIGDYPGILQPMIEVARNKAFTGAPIIPQHLMNAPAEYQYIDRTPIMYRELGQALGVSPLLAEHYTKGYLRYVEMFIADGSENLLWNTEQWGPRPFAKDSPIDYLTYQFIGQQVPFRTKWTEGYFNLKSKAAGITAAYSMLRSEAIRSGEPLERFMGDELNQNFVALNSAFSQIDRMFQDQDTVLSAIRYNPQLTIEQKEAQINQYYAAKNQTLGKFYTQADEVITRLENNMRGK